MILRKIIWNGNMVSLVTLLPTQYIAIRNQSLSVAYGEWEKHTNCKFLSWKFVCRSYLNTKELEESVDKPWLLNGLRRVYEKELRRKVI